MTAPRAGFLGMIVLVVALCADGGFATVDRDKLLADHGVYGTFAAYSLSDDWTKRDSATRIALLSVLKGVVEQHREKIAILPKWNKGLH